MWNKSIKIPNGYTTVTDEDGFKTTTQQYLEHIPCRFKSTTREDERLAGQQNYTADEIIEIMQCNYNNQKTLIDESNGQVYEVKRSYRNDKEMTILLTCQRRE